MSNEFKDGSPTLWLLMLLFLFGGGLGFLIARAGDVWELWTHGRPRDPQLVEQLYHLREGIVAFDQDGGVFDTDENHRVVDLLLGANPEKVVYISADLLTLNLRGEAVDPWGTPLKFDTSLQAIVSAGRNRKFERDGVETDDYWMIGSRDFDPKGRVGWIHYYRFDLN